MSTIKLVKDDTGPALYLSLTDEFTGLPIDVSNASTVVLFKMRASGSTTLKDTVTCSKVVGLVNADGTITTTAPYNVAGYGGRVSVVWNPTSLDTVGNYEGEVEITFNTGMVQTVYNLVKMSIRADF